VSQSMLVLAAIALLVSSAMWLSLRATAGADLTVLPGYCCRRVQWWQANSRYVYLLCGTATALTVVVTLRQLTA
jgi:hypothetical protein